jgi:transposase-like protein
MTSLSEGRRIVRLYVDEGLPRDKIALILGIPHSRVTNALRKFGIRMRPQDTNNCH